VKLFVIYVTCFVDIFQILLIKMNLNHLSQNFKTFLMLLKVKRVEYLLVGGYAVRYYGYSRDTWDLDIWTSIHPQNAMKVAEVCQTFGSGIVELPVDPFQHKNRIIRIKVPPIRIEILDPIIGQQPEVLSRLQGNQTDQIEILTVQSGASFDQCFKERVVDLLDGVEVNIISLHHLKTIKQAGNRPKDMDDLIHL
jgi:hypothetical protein